MANGGTYGGAEFGGGAGPGDFGVPPVIEGLDTILIDGLDVNDLLTWFIAEDPGLQFTLARKKLNWVSSALSDGSIPSGDESHYENAELAFVAGKMVAGSTDSGLTALDELQAKIQKARDVQGGIPVEWTPAGASIGLTWYMVDGEIEEVNTGRLQGWPNAPMVQVHLYLRPFGFGRAKRLLMSVKDHFKWNSLLNGSWRYDNGVGVGTVTFLGALIPSSTAAKRLFVPATFTDKTITMRFKTGTTMGSTTIGVMGRRIGTGDRLTVRYEASSGQLHIRRVDSGIEVSVANVAVGALSTATFYWIRATFDGNDVTGSIYTDTNNPLTAENPVALGVVSYTLTGADATKFGDGGGTAVRGNPGLLWTPADTGWAIYDWNLTGATDIKSSEPIVAFELSEIPGHVPAEGILQVLEGSGQKRSHVEWGLECRNYPANLAPPLLLDSDFLVTSGFAGNPSGSGQYDPDASGNSAITYGGLSATVPTTICGTGANMMHIGSYKVKAHVKGDPGVRVRLAWTEAGGAFKRNDYYPPLYSTDWQEIDLGTISVAEPSSGAQRWEGRIEALGAAGAVTIIVDYLLFVPVERYGVARAPARPIVASTYTAVDHFNQGSGTLDAADLTVAPADGKWHVAASPTPFNINTTNHTLRRTATGDTNLDSGSFARAGTSNIGAVQAQVDTWAVGLDSDFSYVNQIRMGLLLSWATGNNNWVMVVRQSNSVGDDSGSGAQDPNYDHSTVVRVYKRVGGGVPVALAFNYHHVHPSVKMTLLASMDSAGVYQVWCWPQGTKQPAAPLIFGQDSDLAGGLQNGIPGIYDAYTGAAGRPVSRVYDNFVVFAPGTDQVLAANKSLFIQSDEALREVSATLKGHVPMYRSARGLFLPASGDEDRVSRMAVKARRNDVDSGLPDGNPATDAATYSVDAQGRYLTPPGTEI